MRILHLDPDDIGNPLSGGGPVRTLEIYKRLAARHEVTVLTPTFPGSTSELVRDGIRYVRLGRKLGAHGSSHHITFLASLPASVRSYPHDLLIEDTMPPFSTTWTPLFHSRSKPLIASVQWWFASEYTRRLKLPFHWGERYGIRMYRHFITMTQQMANVIQAGHPHADCRVIENGVDERLFDVPLGVGKNILYLGRINIRDKGLDLMLRAWASIPQAKRPRLIIAGQGQDQTQFDKLVDELSLRPWIVQVGKVDAVNRARLLGECRFTLVPSRMETFGMTISEANAAGKIAVVFDQWPMSEVAAPDCPRVQAFDIAGYAAAVQSLLDTPEHYLLTIGARCRLWARRYSWDKVARDQDKYYEEVREAHAIRTSNGRARLAEGADNEQVGK